MRINRREWNEERMIFHQTGKRREVSTFVNFIFKEQIKLKLKKDLIAFYNGLATYCILKQLKGHMKIEGNSYVT